MRFFLSTVLLCSFGVTVTACGDDDDELTPGTGTPSPRMVDPTPGGGTAGGPIAKVLTVFVIDATGEPVSSAPIIVEHPKVSLAGKSDKMGRADFHHAALEGAADVHVFSSAHPFVSVAGID